MRGFTLIEIILAVAIFALMGTLSFGILGHTIDVHEQVSRLGERDLTARLTLLRMSREISMAFVSYHHDCSDPRTTTLFVGKNSSDGMRLDFTSFSRLAYRKNKQESDQNVVSYFIGSAADDSHKRGLIRREKHRIDAYPLEGGREELLLEDVVDLQFQFYNPRTDRWDEDWDTQSSDTYYRLPTFVKIRFKMRHPTSHQETPFSSATRLFIREGLFLPQNSFVRCAQ